MKKVSLINVVLISVLLLAACSTPSATLQNQLSNVLRSAADTLHPQETESVKAEVKSLAQPTTTPIQSSTSGSSLLSAYEGVLQNVYQEVNPSVVNIRVLVKASQTGSEMFTFPDLPFNFPNIPGFPSTPQEQQPSTPQYQEGLGSGFIWDTQGNIVTNNHVVDNADKIEITFSDGTIVPATLVSRDPYSDLAVVKVDLPAERLKPVQLLDSRYVKVGDLAIAIGNPFGLEGTMTVGIVSAIGRSMPTSEGEVVGPTYSIPDLIQTDAPINPGNSGGVLVDESGKMMGVTFAIESTTRTNAGIGFAIPSVAVNRVVPALIEKGHYDHPYLGISGGSLTPDIAKAMNLKADQRGILVGEVRSDGPAGKAGLHGSNQNVEINGQEVNVGGDVIIAIDGQPTKEMDDLISYLDNNGSVGKKVTLTILRNGKSMDVEVTLEKRPEQSETASISSQGNNQQTRAYLGITSLNMVPEIAQAMDLNADQQGVLVEQVQSGSPADQAGLRGGGKSATIGGQSVKIGGDVIIALDSQQVNTVQDLKIMLDNMTPGQKISLTILRSGKQMELEIVLGEPPA
jgi:S1-C subfamily serine protease